MTLKLYSISILLIINKSYAHTIQSLDQICNNNNYYKIHNYTFKKNSNQFYTVLSSRSSLQ